MMEMEKRAADALKSIARNQQLKAYLSQSEVMYPVLLQAAKRFIAGETREEGIQQSKLLASKGYRVSIEYIGENTPSAEDCVKAREEFAALIKEIARESLEAAVCLDLSHIGLTVDRGLAADNINILAKEGREHGISIMVSMEESSKTSDIIQIYKEAAKNHPNVGITVQAYLQRSLDDLKELLRFPGKIRIVKGAYREQPEIAMGRGSELNERFLEMVDLCVKDKHPVSIATHDEAVLHSAMARGYLDLPFVETEMLYGVKAEWLKPFKDKGYPARVYLPYGTDWFLYLCHRLAEHAPNIYGAIADMVNVHEARHEIRY